MILFEAIRPIFPKTALTTR